MMTASKQRTGSDDAAVGTRQRPETIGRISGIERDLLARGVFTSVADLARKVVS